MSTDSPWVRGALVVTVVFVLQEGLLRGLRIQGIRPDLLLAIGLVAGIVGGPGRGSVLAFFAALLGDLFVDTPFGLSALVACTAALLAGAIQDNLRANHRWSLPLLTGVMSCGAVVVWAVMGTMLGLPSLLRPHLAAVALVVGVVNAAVSLPLGVLVRWVFVAGTPTSAAGAARGYTA